MIRLLRRTLVATALACSAVASPAHATDDGTWYAPSISQPGPRREHVGVIDTRARRAVIFAGWNFHSGDPSGLFNDLWQVDLDGGPSWAPLVPLGTSPGVRHSPQMGYDAARKRKIVFGGYGRHAAGDDLDYLNDVFQLDLDGTAAWTELHPTGVAPMPRLAGVAVYDPLRQRFVGFGGTRGLPTDTYELDLSGDPAWSTIETGGGGPDSTSPSNSPPPGYGQTAIYDPVRDRMVMFGGSTSDAYLGVTNDVWALSLGDDPAWTKLTPSGTPPSPRRTLTSIYDPVRDRMIVFGGWDGDQSDAPFLHDVWALSLGDDPTWTELDPDGGPPVGRDAMSAVYDAIADRMIVYGGWSGQTMLSDTWILRWGRSHDEASVQGSATATPDQANLNWQLVATTGPVVGVYRRSEKTLWTSIATAHADAQGGVAFTDASVDPGTRYAYQLVVSSMDGPVLGGEVWVDVPSSTIGTGGGSAEFAFDPVRPNPAVGAFQVSFRLASDAPAAMAVFDVRGRHVWSRDLVGLGAGPHVVAVESGTEFAPGLYFVRLEQAGASLVRRVAVGAP
jgi:hypothetical protein